MYKIVRLFFNNGNHVIRRTIRSGLTLEEAKAHCNDPETSSSTCKGSKACARTRKYGPWFDSYTET